MTVHLLLARVCPVRRLSHAEGGHDPGTAAGRRGGRLRTQLDGSRDASGPWHIVEAGATEGLCHESFAVHAPARPLIELVDLDPDDRCLTCERTYRGRLARPIPWPGVSGAR